MLRQAERLIITTDADCRAGKNWISIISSYFSENPVQLAICPVTLSGKGGLFCRLQELEFLSLQGVTAGTALNKNPVMCNGANLAFTKQTWLNHAHALHPESDSGDDIFLMLSLKKEKDSVIKWIESDEASISSSVTEDIISFFRQRIRWFSKWKYYDDRYVNLLSFITFATNLLIVCSVVAGIITGEFLLPILLIILKSIVDFLILANTLSRYKKKELMKYFLPAQIFYPMYVVLVAIVSMVVRPLWKQ